MSVNEIEPPKAQSDPKHVRALGGGDAVVTVTTSSPLPRYLLCPSPRAHRAPEVIEVDYALLLEL